jgi:hypothetical protein
MSFENVQLPDFLLVDLYKDCLVELEKFKPSQQLIPSPAEEQTVYSEEVTEPSRIRFLGENQKKVAVIVQNEDAIFLGQEDLQFLTNVLKACALNLGDIAIINIDKKPLRWEQLEEELQPRQVLLFGVEPGDIHLPFSIPDFQTINYSGSTYLRAPLLATINRGGEEGKLLKTRLWTNLQTIFSITK